MPARTTRLSSASRAIRSAASWPSRYSTPSAKPGKPDLFGSEPIRIEKPVGPDAPNRRPDVAKVETFLDRTGHLDLARTEGPTGYYGGRVDQGIRGFQKDNALEIDGLINPDGETLQRLGTLLSRRELSLQPSGSSSMLRPAPTEILPERPPLYTQANASVQDRVADWLGRRGTLLVGARDSAAPSSLPSGLQRAAAGADDTESAQLEEPGRRASREPVPAPLGNDASAAEEPPHLTPVLDKIEQTYRRRVANLRRSGMPIAAANLEHFLDASGEARKLPRDEAIKLQPIKEAEATNNGRFVSRTFRGISERNDAVRRLPHLRQGHEPFRFEDSGTEISSIKIICGIPQSEIAISRQR